ncbi:MAG: hypothetical protein NTW60_03960 [Candidatus Wolfebacteria bacterium]|nr:hypothetical protein [Candidatus Wolfebacteria bacterium]
MFKQKEKQGDELLDEAKRLGVATDGIIPGVISIGGIREAVLQERVRSAKNTKYAQLTWIVALISAIASLVSAIAAWIAISK